MKNRILILFFSTLPSLAVSADFDYLPVQNNPPLIERNIRAYSDALIIESVQEKCVSMFDFDPRDRLIPNKSYFIVKLNPPVQEKVKQLATDLARKRSDDEIFSKDLIPDQILTQSAWCRLVGIDLMQKAREDLSLYTERP